MDYSALIVEISQNPMFFAAVIAVLYNLGMYIAAMAHSRALEKWDVVKFVETLTVFETLFVVLMGMAEVPAKYVAIIGVAVNMIRSLKSAIETWRAPAAPTKPAA